VIAPEKRLSNWTIHQKMMARDSGVCSQCGTDTIKLKAEFKALFRPIGWKNKMYGGPDNHKEYDWLTEHRIPIAFADRRFWEADHSTPICEGGSVMDLSNIRTLCIPCHLQATALLAGRIAKRRRCAA
jgi:5-methylcytosine-specific restriction protein A